MKSFISSNICALFTYYFFYRSALPLHDSHPRLQQLRTSSSLLCRGLNQQPLTCPQTYPGVEIPSLSAMAIFLDETYAIVLYAILVACGSIGMSTFGYAICRLMFLLFWGATAQSKRTQSLQRRLSITIAFQVLFVCSAPRSREFLPSPYLWDQS